MNQLSGFIKRNFKLRIRNKLQLTFEIYQKITILIVLIVYNFLFVSEKFPPETYNAEILDGRFQTVDLFISPDNQQTRNLGDLIKTRYLFLKLKYFNTSDQMIQFYDANSNGSSIEFIKETFGIEFSDFPNSYKLYHKYEPLLFSQNKIQLFTDSRECRNGSLLYNLCGGNKLLYDGLAYLQYVLDSSINKLRQQNSTYPNFFIKNMPKESYVREQTIFDGIKSYYFTLIYLYSVTSFVINVVAEKEKKNKELMKLMGLKDSIFWLSWILTYLLQFTVFNFFLVILLNGVKFFKSFSITLVFYAILQCFSVVSIVFGCLMSTFFQKSKTAGSAVASLYSFLSLFYLVVFLPRVFNVDLPNWIQWVISLIFPCAFSFAIDQALFIQAKYGTYFSADFIVNAARPNSLSILSCLLMLIADGVLYFILTIYFDKVIQGEYGRARSPIYFLKPSFWLNRKKTVDRTTLVEIINDQNDCELVNDEFKDKIALKLGNLVKKFKNEKGTEYNAIDNLNLTVYSGQITAILGHNGAGKTTLFNILTGLLKPDSGTAKFYDYNILSDNDLPKIRKMSGVCLQQDVLYDLLDCFEHLELYAYLKNVPKNQIKDKINDILDKVGLAGCKKSRANQLSGGQKRKLGIAIALIGDPKILILDEPTSGMDPNSRRDIWSLLQSLRQNRVIILSTHFMDEADILADRKAVISKGKLKCVGSSLYLKNRFGLGYHLNLIGTNTFDLEPASISSLIRKHVPKGEFERVNGKEVSYTLPIEAVQSFQYLFKDIEINRQSMGIENVAISMTTLEEVFLKLAEENHDDNDKNKNYNIKSLNADQEVILEREKIKMSNFRFNFLKWIPIHFYSILKLRYLMALRNKTTLLYRFITPLPMLILSIILPQLISSLNNLDPNKIPTVNLAINDYATEKNPFVIVNNSNVDHLIDNLIVNNELNPQPFKFTKSDLNNSFRSYAGIIYQKSLEDLILYYNDSAVFSVPYLLNTFSNLNSRLDGLSPINASLTSWPQVKTQDVSFFDASSFTTLIILGISLIFPLVSFAAEVVQDRELKCKNQLRLSGCGFWTYWIPTLIAYLIQSSFLPIILFFVIYAIPPLNIPEFMPGGAVFTIILTTIIYIPCSLLVIICMSFMFSKKETALSLLTTLVSLLFTIPYLITNLTQLKSINLSNTLHLIFTIVDPIYGFVGTYSRIAQVYTFQKNLDIVANKEFTGVPFKLYFEFELFRIPLSLIFGLINILIYGFIIYTIEAKKQGVGLFDCWLKNAKVKQNSDQIQTEDLDVHQERLRVARDLTGDSTLVLDELRKEFGNNNLEKFGMLKSLKKNRAEKKIAVRNLSIGFRQGEIFGLLGTNGAGKTTTINMICAELEPDAGSIKIKNQPFDIQLFCQNVAVCPQHNPFWEDLSLVDHLQIYASLKKLSDQSVISLSYKLMEMLGITEHGHKQVKNLSGGTKRKLAYAITLLGNSEITLLDEPSTGLDPQSKRNFWNIISENLVKGRKSAILTTHSMEEAEALCHRIGIMVNGELKCLGSSLYLKEKYGSGYMLEAKFNPSKKQYFNETIIRIFNGKAACSEDFYNYKVYNVPSDHISSLASIFGELERAKLEGILFEYSFSQCTLEQVFIKFAKEK
uniref:ATP-binding cassette transporter subfamily A member 5 n=1 Tax=Brachionus rotundiformis TaxID=96890 RepID=A0A7H9SKR6_9BILA|nr:ATP-binding cassette transporter subfamily A member 5 [Brachionus rotundiformis]